MSDVLKVVDEIEAALMEHMPDARNMLALTAILRAALAPVTDEEVAEIRKRHERKDTEVFLIEGRHQRRAVSTIMSEGHGQAVLDRGYILARLQEAHADRATLLRRDALREAELAKERARVEVLEEFQRTITGWRELDQPDGFCRFTAQYLSNVAVSRSGGNLARRAPTIPGGRGEQDEGEQTDALEPKDHSHD